MRFISKKAFRAWLEAQPEDFTADRGSSYSCPLAKATGYLVTSHYFRRQQDEREVETLPTWAQAFVNSIDTVEDDETPVTRAEMLAALEER